VSGEVHKCKYGKAKTCLTKYSCSKTENMEESGPSFSSLDSVRAFLCFFQRSIPMRYIQPLLSSEIYKRTLCLFSGLLFFSVWTLLSLVLRVSGYKSRGPGFDSQPYQIFWEVGGLERGPLSLVRTIEEIF
jgi:hypothetical protein